MKIEKERQRKREGQRKREREREKEKEREKKRHVKRYEDFPLGNFAARIIGPRWKITL